MARPPKELVDAICESLRDRPEEWCFYDHCAYHHEARVTISLHGEFGLPCSISAGRAIYRCNGLGTWPWHWLNGWRRELRRSALAARMTSDWMSAKEKERRDAEDRNARLKRSEEDSTALAIATLRGAA